MHRPSLSATAILCLSFFTCSITSKVIVWDLGNVLCTVSKFRAAMKIGFQGLCCSQKKTRALTMDVLSAVRNYKNILHVPDDQGNRLSSILCEYQAGIYPSRELLSNVINTMDRLDTIKFFKNQNEKQLIKTVITLIFDPYEFAHMIKVIPEGMALVKACAKMVDTEGNPLHTQMILSNWDPESFHILYHIPRNRTLFTHFDPQNIIISGMFKALCGLKPDPFIFQYLISHANVPAHEIIFIDDQIINVNAAKKLGIQGIHLKNKNYKALRAELKKAGVF